MGLFKKKQKFESKYHIDEFVSFHGTTFQGKSELKFGVISAVRQTEDGIVYDIKVGGEATWLAKDIKEDKIVKND
ncbi:MAG: hypothetical protein K6A63_00060 [Acholeplasmatales bacterium]|nr:hypothetical protein [Acholeplasmatales bacterium]